MIKYNKIKHKVIFISLKKNYIYIFFQCSVGLVIYTKVLNNISVPLQSCLDWNSFILFCSLIGCLQQGHSQNPSPSPSNHTGALQAVGLPPSRRANQSLPQNCGLPSLLSSCGDFATYSILSSWEWCNASQHERWPPVQLHQATLWNDLE